MLTNNEIKDIAKAIRSWRNLLKVTTRRVTTQEWGSLNFLRPLATAHLSLTEDVLTRSGKSVLSPLELTTAASTTDTAVQKKTLLDLS